MGRGAGSKGSVSWALCHVLWVRCNAEIAGEKKKKKTSEKEIQKSILRRKKIFKITRRLVWGLCCSTYFYLSTQTIGNTVCVPAEGKSSGIFMSSPLCQPAGPGLCAHTPNSSQPGWLKLFELLVPATPADFFLLLFFFPAWRELKCSFELLCQQICSKPAASGF